MRMQVGLRRLDGFMTEPQRDHGAVDTRLRSSIAALCLSTCGDTCFDFNDGQLSPATRTCFARSDWTLSALSRPPCTLGNKAIPPFRAGSLSHAWSARRANVVSGVVRSFRPLATHR